MQSKNYEGQMGLRKFLVRLVHLLVVNTVFLSCLHILQFIDILASICSNSRTIIKKLFVSTTSLIFTIRNLGAKTVQGLFNITYL